MSDDISIELSEAELSEQVQLRHEKLAGLIDSGMNPYLITKFDVNSSASEIIENFERREGEQVKIAGRIMTWRNMGKANFINILDSSGNIQV